MSLFGEAIAWLTDPANYSGPGGIPARLFEHVVLALVSLAIAVAIALPIGLWIGHTRRGVGFAINLANLGRALPSLAVIGIILPITAAIDPELGFKVYPVVIAMVLLAIPPILVNTHAGIAGVDPDLVEAGRAMGMRGDQLVRRVEIPIALPVIIGGIRSASAQIIATLTLGAIFAGPGLGRFLVEGIAQLNDGMLFGGVVLVAGLSLLSELIFAILQRRLVSPGLRTMIDDVPPTAATPWLAAPQPPAQAG
jgi:osmoprotectant transport system permease protein